MTPNAIERCGRRALPPGVRYDLRHSHASALHYCGLTVPEAAERVGDGPVLHVETSAHVIKQSRGERYADLNALLVCPRVPQRRAHG